MTRFPINIFAIFLFSPLIGFPQGEGNVWYFGNHAGLDFNSGLPLVLNNCSLMFQHPTYSTTISDTAGNLLFYVDMSYIYNRNQQVMPNGSMMGMCGTDGYFQPSFAARSLSSDSIWFLFTMGSYTTPGCSVPQGLRYNIIDMSLDGGLGDIPPGQKGITIPGAELTARMLTGTRAQNNRDVWIVVREFQNSNEFLTYHITNAGIDMNPITSTSLITLHYPYLGTFAGMFRFSPDGTRLVATYDSVTEMCHFNLSTGEITPMFLFKVGTQLNALPSAEFSIDNKFLYMGTSNYLNGTTIYQYDATKEDSVQFKQSEIMIHQNSYGSYLQKGPDNKIYCTHLSVDSVDVINHPSMQGFACGWQRGVLGLNGNYTLRGFVQTLQRYFVYITHSNHCQAQPVYFTSSICPQPDSIHWDFGDPSSGPNNYSFYQNPSHTYILSGTYTVTLFVRHIDKRTDTSWQQVTINPTFTPALGPDRSVCQGDSVIFDAGACSGCTYQWTDLGTMTIVGTSQTYKTGQAGTYEAAVTNTYGCIGRDTVHLITNLKPSVTNNPLSKTICSGESTNIALTSNVPGTTFHWAASLTSGNVSGFSPDSGLVINQVLINSLSTPGIVTYHITPKVGSCVGTTVDFPVTVNPGDSVKVSISASNNNICSGTSVTFTATPTNGGSSPSYQWKVNGNNVGANSPNYTYNPISVDIVSCVLTSSITVCISNNPATSNSIQMVVNPLNPVSVTISPSANPVCNGTSVTFLASPTNGGSSPVFQWKINGTIVGTNSPTYTYNPASGDQVSCILTSNVTCPVGNPATSNQITMTVNPVLPVSVSITASNNPVCSGNAVTYTALPVNGGSSPSYQWKVNGINMGPNSNTYTYTPASGDQVSCILTSNVTCPIGNPATSNIITMNVATSPVVTFTRCNDSVTTTNAQPFKLKGGIPLGGTYSGPGVTNNIFYPVVAGVGTKTITYTYTNVAFCSATASLQFVIRNPSFVICGSDLTDPRDNKIYPTIQIGSQCWMAANLNYGYANDEYANMRDNCIPEKYCYQNNPVNCVNLGGLYQWDELVQYDVSVSNQGLCPPTWHVPTENDWNILFAEWTNNAFAAWPLIYTGFSGFNAFFSGTTHQNRTTDWKGFATFFWSSTSHGSMKAWAHGMNSIDPSVSGYPSLRTNAFPVRCIKD